MTADSIDVGKLLADLAYATEALAEIRAIAMQTLPSVSLSRALHDPLIDIMAAANQGLRLDPKEEAGHA